MTKKEIEKLEAENKVMLHALSRIANFGCEDLCGELQRHVLKHREDKDLVYCAGMRAKAEETIRIVLEGRA